MTTRHIGRITDCDGCDDPTPGIGEYEVRVPDSDAWHRVRYCRECYLAAEHNACDVANGYGGLNGCPDIVEIKDAR